MPAFQAAIEGTREIGLAVMATSFSLLAVFLPVALWAHRRQVHVFVRVDFFVCHCRLAARFIYADSHLAARLIKKKEEPAEAPAVDEGSVTTRSLSFAINTTRHSPKSRDFTGQWTELHENCYMVDGAPVGHSACLRSRDFQYRPLFMFVGKNFFPLTTNRSLRLNVRAPRATPISDVRAAERIATDMRKLPGVTDTLTTIGGGQQERSCGVDLCEAKFQSKIEASQEQLMLRARRPNFSQVFLKIEYFFVFPLLQHSISRFSIFANLVAVHILLFGGFHSVHSKIAALNVHSLLVPFPLLRPDMLLFIDPPTYRS